MNTKIDDRLPKEVGQGALPAHPAVQTPWNKLISYIDAYKYACRHHAGMGAVYQEVLRILIPDYEKRVDLMCKVDVGNKNYVFNKMEVAPGVLYKDIHSANHFLHPFFCGTDNTGGFRAGCFGDSGDERLFMQGRVNDFGTYRVEKELDACPWDIMGSEICRVSTAALEEIGRAYGEHCEYSMVEARGCGDLHCRVICENRDKYPAPPRKGVWDNFGPCMTEDQIKFTPREEMYDRPQHMRGECDYKYRNGLCMELDSTQEYVGGAVDYPLGSDYSLNPINLMIKQGLTTQEKADQLIASLFRACGKMMFLDSFAIKGLRDWLGVPEGVNDGRVLGGYIEVLLQTIRCPYTIVAFNKDEVTYDIDRKYFNRKMPIPMTSAYNAMWYGMVKTLVSPEWFVWEETEGVDKSIYRVKIAMKIDKFCL